MSKLAHSLKIGEKVRFALEHQLIKTLIIALLARRRQEISGLAVNVRVLPATMVVFVSI